MSGQRNDRERQSRQMNKKANLMQAVTNWRNLSPEAKTNWQTFASLYPQPSRKNPGIDLTGYQLFIKRQQYLYLNEGIKSEFLEAPFSEVLILDDYTFSVDQTENCLDVTENYIKNFGLIPSPGQFLLIKVLAYAVNSGQFFPVVTQTIEILESYIDGLFISLHLPANCRDTVFSVYLSKPVNQSVVYSGTKTRYMGCFTTKTFLGLTDTPDSYEGQAGKKVVVKADESGLEFVPDTGGGLTCETLPDCPVIISIDQTLDNLVNAIVGSGQSSIPAIKFGALYNNYVGTDPRLICAEGWRIPNHATYYLPTRTFLGGDAVAGGPLKETGTTFWQTPNTGATNSAKMNMRGSGYRSYTGAFTAPNQTHKIMKLEVPQIYNPESPTVNYNNTTWQAPSSPWATGVSIRPVKIATTLVNGQSGVYYGNDGKIYRTICINNIEWVADPLAETKFRNGDLIPIVTDNAAWQLMTSAAMCYLNNNIANAFM